MNREQPFSLILRAESVVVQGVGRAFGRTVLKHGKNRYDARELSEALGNNTDAAAGETRISRAALEQLGLGPLGCFIDGTPILPVPLRAADLLDRIPEGFWTGFEYGACPWTEQAKPETLFRRHLDFLRIYGISGGVVLNAPEEAANLLGPYLSALSAEENCRILVFTRRNFFRRLTGITGEKEDEIPDTFSLCPGVTCCLYKALLKRPEVLKGQWEILILIDPEEFLDYAGEKRFNRLRSVKARLRLGIFTGGGETILTERNAVLDRFFGIQGETRDLAWYLFRPLHASFALPSLKKTFSKQVRKPPEPFASGEKEDGRGFPQLDFWNTEVTHGGRFEVQRKFQGLNISVYKEELDLFSFDPPAGDEQDKGIFPGLDMEDDRFPVFGKLTREQQNGFLHWRGEFRRGRIPAAGFPCVCLYARELILAMGGRESRGYFRELLKLWRTFRAGIPKLDRLFPGWLMDFAVLYNIAGDVLDELLLFAEDAESGILKDLYLHQKYIAQDNPVLLKDLLTLLPGKTRMLLRGENESPRLAGEVETALNRIDEYLRKTCGKRFLEFFYPSLTTPLDITAFAPYDDLGQSSYSAEWMRFCEHRPLKQFLDALVLYLHARLKGCGEWPLKNSGPHPWRRHPWRRLIDEALGFPPEPDTPVREAPPAKKAAVSEGFRLAAEKLPLLREESDMVRELLRIEVDEAPAGKAAVERAERPAVVEAAGDAETQRGNPAGFFAGLEETEKAVLTLLSRNGTREELEALAKTAGTMPELLIDRINEKFQELFRDLLIDTEAEGLGIQDEYREMVRDLIRRINA
jgi:hypothetical protein